ncbi:MAG: DNA mismatch repair protein MutS, partial [Halarchaeum sp.]
YALFATHHHDLTTVADDLAGARNLHFRAERDGDDVEFVHEVAPGAATASYGVEVARQAGVPDDVVARARELVAAREAPSEVREGDAPAAGDAGGDVASADGGREVLDELAALDLAEMTPIEAMTALNRLQRDL